MERPPSSTVFGYDEAGAGAVNGAMLVVVVVGNLLAVAPASRLSDRIGRKPVIYIACLVGAIGVAIMAFAPHVAVAFLGAGLFARPHHATVAHDALARHVGDGP